MGPYARRSSSLSPFLPESPVAWAGTHDDVPAIEWLCDLATDQIHTPPCTRQDAVFQGFVTCLPSRPTLRRSFTLNRHRSHQTGGCPWLLLTTSNLYHLPSVLLLIESLLLAPMRNHTGFTRPAPRLLRMCPWRTTHLPVRLWPRYPPRSWRAVTLDFAIPPVPIPNPLSRTL